MVHPAAADARFQRRAHHPMGLAGLQGGQQGPGITLQQRAAHLPAAPPRPQGRIGPQRFIQGHRHPGRQGFQAHLIGRIERLLQPFEPGITCQALGPERCGGAIPTAIGIKPQPGPLGQPIQQPLQQLQLLRGGQRRHLPLKGWWRERLIAQLAKRLQGPSPRGQQPGRGRRRQPTPAGRAALAIKLRQGRPQGKGHRRRPSRNPAFQLLALEFGGQLLQQASHLGVGLVQGRHLAPTQTATGSLQPQQPPPAFVQGPMGRDHGLGQGKLERSPVQAQHRLRHGP